MSDKKLFIVKTYIDKKDYHKFLYIATFFRRKFMIPILLVVSAIMGYFVAINKEVFSWREFFIYWILLLLITLFAIVVKIETRNREKRKEDKKSGIFSACETLEFFDDYGKSLGKFFAKSKDAKFSFLGVKFKDASKVNKVRITVGEEGIAKTSSNYDKVAMDDFLYDEPVAK